MLVLHGREILSSKRLAKIKKSEREDRLYRQAGGAHWGDESKPANSSARATLTAVAQHREQFLAHGDG